MRIQKSDIGLQYLAEYAKEERAALAQKILIGEVNPADVFKNNQQFAKFRKLLLQEENIMAPKIIGQHFPDYQFQEYPKWVKNQQGKDFLVNDEAEEISIVGEKEELPQDEAENNKSDSEASDVDIETLRTEADSLGIMYDKRWGIEKMQQAIAEQKRKSPK